MRPSVNVNVRLASFLIYCSGSSNSKVASQLGTRAGSVGLLVAEVAEVILKCF